MWNFERLAANPPLIRAMLGTLDHDDNNDPTPATEGLGIQISTLVSNPSSAGETPSHAKSSNAAPHHAVGAGDLQSFRGEPDDGMFNCLASSGYIGVDAAAMAGWPVFRSLAAARRQATTWRASCRASGAARWRLR